MFIEQAYKGENHWWRVAITTAASTAMLVWTVIMYFVLTEEQIQAAYDMVRELPNNLALVMNLAPFVVLLGVLFVSVLVLHRRSLISLTTSRKSVDYGRIAFAFGLIVLISIVSFGISFAFDSSEIAWNFKAVPFLILFFISILFFPIQIAFEEYLFRGYFMQQIGIVVRNRWFPLVITSVMFGLFHSANPEVMEMGFGIMAFYIGTGFLLGIMTLMDEGLELALGFHLGNNLMAALLITSDFAALETDALFKFTGSGDAGILQEMILSMAITYPVILLILSWKYRWKNWRHRLFGPVVSKESFIQTNDEYSQLQ